MNKERESFFSKIKKSEHRNFEITMFSISIIISAVVFAGMVLLVVFWNKAGSSRISDEEANASSVTDTAIAQSTKEPISASGNAVITEEDLDFSDIDEDLTKKDYGYTTAVVNLRSSTSLTSSVITKVPMGARVKLIKLEDDEWMKVEYEGETGYINAMYLSTEKPTPIVTIAPSTTPVRKTPAPTATAAATPTAKVKETPVPPKKTKKPVKTKKPIDNTLDNDDEEEEEPTEEPVVTETPTEKPKPTEAPATDPPTDPPTEVPKNTPDIKTE